MLGKVKSYNQEKGYGFITGEDGINFFFHYSELKMDGYKHVSLDRNVEFDIIETTRGLQAINIIKLK